MNKSIIEVGLVVAIVVVAWGGCVEAEPLNPDAFASLAAFPTAPGSYEFGTDPNNPIFVGPGVSLSGVIYHGLAVFDFDSVTIGNGMIVKSWGTALPLVVLSRSDFTITGTGQFDVSGFGTGTIYSSLPGVGGGHGGIQLISSPNGLGAGWGPGGGQPGMTHAFIFGAGGGGGFGGHGGTGGDGGPPFSGGPGGAAVQTDLFHQLQGGSGGGAGSQGGGGGGGAVEIGAVRSITIGGGGLLAGGGDGGLGSAVNDGHGGGGGGGGSGGVVFLHADSVTVNSLIDASGGDGGYGGQTFMGRSAGGGGGGGGGQVFIMTAPGGFNMSGTIDVSGGAGGDANTDGFGTPGRGGLDGVIGVTTPYVPEPSSITLLVLGMAGVLAVGRSQYARRTLKDVRD